MTDNISSNMQDGIRHDMHQALKSGHKEKLAVLRLILSALKQKAIDSRLSTSGDEPLVVLSQLAKQRQESIAQFSLAGRKDLVAKEQFELEVIRSYLPEPLDATALDQLIEQTIAQVQAQSIKEMGTVMQALKKQLAHRADMGIVSQKVRAKLVAK